jgi:hypothetical protein
MKHQFRILLHPRVLLISHLTVWASKVAGVVWVAAGDDDTIGNERKVDAIVAIDNIDRSLGSISHATSSV